MTSIGRYATAAAFRAALLDRLRQNAAAKGEAWHVRQRKRMVFDRLLARLLVAAPDRWLLKGAVALDFRLSERARATMDLDLVHQDNEEAATNDLQDAQRLGFGDFFTFQIDRTDKLENIAEGAVRFRVRADIDGRLFDRVALDIGFARATELSSELVTGPDLFGFAGIPPIQVPTIPLELHVAEKLHAYTRIYGDGSQSSRVKDLVDLLLIRSTTALEAGRLRNAIEQTFLDRDTQAIPSSMPPPPNDWRVPYRRLAIDVAIEPDLEAAYRRAAEFLDPILGRDVTDDANWYPEGGLWREPIDHTATGST